MILHNLEAFKRTRSANLMIYDVCNVTTEKIITQERGAIIVAQKERITHEFIFLSLVK